MRPVLAVIVASALALGPSVQPAEARSAEGSVTSLSVVPSAGKAEIVVGVAGGFEVRDFTLRSPDRIVLDMSGVSLRLGSTGYDHVARGGIKDVKFSQFKVGTVRVVVYLDGAHSYQLSKADGEVRVTVAVPQGAQFDEWHIAGSRARETRATPARDAAVAGEPTSGPDRAIDRAVAERTREASDAADAAPMRTKVQQRAMSPEQIAQQTQQRSQQPHISVVWQGSDIRDVIAAFAQFSGRTIIPGNNVSGLKVDAEIRDQPWDVALQAILSAQGLAATEDANGIIIVDTQDRIAAQKQTEQLVNRIVRLNYQRATPVGDQIRQRLLQCIPSERGSGASGAAAPPAAGQPPAGVTPGAQSATVSAPSASSGGDQSGSCRGRGSVTSDETTNSVSITAPASTIDALYAFAADLDLRQPQVNIKAKIVLVNRTDLDALGIKYDLGSAKQFFSDVIQRVDSAGNPTSPSSPPTVLLGGNTVSAVANASGTIAGPALRLIYSTALGNFDFSTFIEALQSVNLVDVQSEPSVTILNNKTAQLVSGSEISFAPVSGGTGGALNVVVAAVRIQTGVKLLVTPSVTNNHQVMMHVEASKSTFAPSADGPLIDNNSGSTDVLVADGQTIVLAGLTETSVQETKTGIPMLVDLPLIGRLFGYTQRTETRRDLIILLTPHVIDEGQQPSDAVRH